MPTTILEVEYLPFFSLQRDHLKIHTHKNNKKPHFNTNTQVTINLQENKTNSNLVRPIYQTCRYPLSTKKTKLKHTFYFIN